MVETWHAEAQLSQRRELLAQEIDHLTERLTALRGTREQANAAANEARGPGQGPQRPDGAVQGGRNVDRERRGPEATGRGRRD
jgi:hypothetical protein